MQKVVGVKFKQGGKIYYYNCNQLKVNVKDKVIVETENGLELAVVNNFIDEKELTNNEQPLKNIIRIANNKDLQTKANLEKKQKEILLQTKKLINKHNLEMDLIGVECAFDSSKIIFIYTAEGRVDFRELIKELASIYKSKIELRQVGIRDETKIVGGLGPCGREVCCKNFLQDFEKVSIKMAKNQNLSLNPTNISGLCGRLMCCLSYENEYYAETIKLMPKVNSKVLTPDGEGIVVYNDLLKKIVSVKFVSKDDETKIIDYDLSNIKFSNKGNEDE